MTELICFAAGLVAGVLIYRYGYAQQCRNQDISCSEDEKEKEIAKQLQRLMAYSGKER